MNDGAKAVIFAVIVLLILGYYIFDFIINNSACEQAGGVYLRDLLTWKCVVVDHFVDFE